MSDNSQSNTSQVEIARSNGRVKWFNNKSGYGFITCGEGEHIDEDVFVHHTALKTGEDQYRYLIQGEYVEFNWSKSETGDHEWHATDVTGMSGGKLMCETRNESRQQMRDRSDNDDQPRRPSRPPHRVRGGGPREYEDDMEWKLVPVRGSGKGRGRGGKGRGRGDDGSGRLPRPRADDEA